MRTNITQKSYTHITGRERHTIDILRYMKLSIREIARRLERSPSSISEEIRRNGGAQVYDCDRADAKARKRWNHSHSKLRLKQAFLRTFVEQHIKDGCSPQQNK